MALRRSAMHAVQRITRPGSPGLRMVLAICCSLLLHAWLLAIFRLPQSPLGFSDSPPLNVLLIPLDRRDSPAAVALRPEPALPQATPVKAALPKQKNTGDARPTKQIAGTLEPQRQSPKVLEDIKADNSRSYIYLGPTTPLKSPPISSLADAGNYLTADKLSRSPELPEKLSAEYPREAYREGRHGMVFLQLMINADGKVAEALAAPDSDREFADAALAAVRNFRFTPGELDGRPARARVYVVIYFVLE
ncbi:MAG: TonB family protein [Burkholderiales bacterium]